MRTRFDDFDKKFETTNRKMSAVLEELSKCKTELQYWRSTSPSGSTPTPNTKPNHCRCGDTSNENDSLLVPEVFKPIDDKSTNAASEVSTSGDNGLNGGNEADGLPVVHRVEGKHCKRKLSYLDEKKCDKKSRKSWTLLLASVALHLILNWVECIKCRILQHLLYLLETIFILW